MGSFSNILNSFFPVDNKGRISILGFKVYTDDLLILLILLFLYMEKVNDQFLFTILILLLFS